MADVTERIDGTRDWRALVGALNLDHAPDPDGMRATYTEWTERARRFLVERDLVTLPDGEECLVTPSPHFQRPVIAVASYSLPPPFRPTRTGHFFVPYPPDGTPVQQAARRAWMRTYLHWRPDETPPVDYSDDLTALLLRAL